MREHLHSGRIIAPYVSRFDEYSSEVKEVEKFKGTVHDAVSALRTSLKKGDGSVYPRILLVHEITKATVDEKILRNDEDTLKAIGLCVDLAIPVYYEDSSALAKLNDYETFIRNNHLEKILESKIEEKPDTAIMPQRSGEDDLRKAEKLLKRTEGAPILAIGIGHRGFRRSLDLFLDYRYQSNTPDSIFWPVRYSSHSFDSIPRLSIMEKQNLIEMAGNRKIVVISPPDLFPILVHGDRKTLNRLLISKDYFSRLVFGTEREPADVIAIPLLLAKPEQKFVKTIDKQFL